LTDLTSTSARLLLGRTQPTPRSLVTHGLAPGLELLYNTNHDYNNRDSYMCPQNMQQTVFDSVEV